MIRNVARSFSHRPAALVLGLAACGCAAPSGEEAGSSSIPSRPNIILMMSDDQGWGDVEYPQQLAPGDVFPGHSEVKTPELREMAAAGLQFHRMYSHGSNCSPTRSSFVTGRSPRRNHVDMAYNDGLRNLELTIAELAQTQGYMTGHFGKWHLGNLNRTPEPDADDLARCGGRCFGRSGGDFYSAPWHHGYERAWASPQALPTFEPMRIDPAGPLPSEGNHIGAHYWTG
ncbi:MAG: sulfatase-like hydrolase/transferase, partial [Holophagales bacterium]|nr:sulfatase-like hydrolase/transferase [Holophagales bacterium]